MRALAAWREHDVARSLHAVDRDAIAATESARTLVLELLARGGGAKARPRLPVAAADGGAPPRDLFNACAQLGRLLAAAGASPTLAVTTIDGAVAALASAGAEVDPSLVPAARASCAEGYVAAIADAERIAARRAWEWPACAVRLDGERAAIACGFPEGDAEALADWAARVALGASKAGVKAVVLSGPGAVRAELEGALALVGVRVVRVEGSERGREGEGAAAATEAKKPWLRLPWRR